MNADNLRSGAAGLTLADAAEAGRPANERRTMEDGAIACLEARRVYVEVMGDRLAREREADEQPRGSVFL